MTPGERRPREGRCERCDRPLTDEVYERFQYAHASDPGTTLTSPLPDWLPLTSRDGRCQSYTDALGRPARNCDGEPIDWRARALAAEAALAERTPAEFLPTSTDTTRLHRIRARLLELVPADGTMSLWDDAQRLDRALADAEARGRQRGLLEAVRVLKAESDWCEGAARNARLARDMDGVRRNEYRQLAILQVMDEITALAEEADRG